jgi:pimeloyl-ACP methyl ester carboxylesterase
MFVALRILLMLLFVSTLARCALAQGVEDEARGSASFDRLVNVGGGRRLHINCSGMNFEGSPTVLLESGAGNDSSVWNRVQAEVAKFTRVCSYDRAGLGSSDPVSAPRTIVAVTEDLHTLLANAKVFGPYVLVGHSLGGILVRLYASYYPAQVVGMVLVDSAHEDEPDRGLALIPQDTFKEMLKKLGPEDLVVQSPENIASCSIRTVMDALNWHGDIPLVVLTQGRPYGPDMFAVPSIAPKAYQLHLALQRDLMHRSSRGRQVIAEKSGHGIHQDQPELVIDAIRHVVKEVKTTGRTRKQSHPSRHRRHNKALQLTAR